VTQVWQARERWELLSGQALDRYQHGDPGSPRPRARSRWLRLPGWPRADRL